VLTAAGLAALGYILAAPNWAAAHQYWQFYFLPFVTTSMVLMWRLLVRTLAERPRPRLRILQSSAFWMCSLRQALAASVTRVEAYAVKHRLVRANFLSRTANGATGRPSSRSSRGRSSRVDLYLSPYARPGTVIPSPSDAGQQVVDPLHATLGPPPKTERMSACGIVGQPCHVVGERVEAPLRRGSPRRSDV
jgi:hypothetical protein